jgi:hypothetical protein
MRRVGIVSASVIVHAILLGTIVRGLVVHEIHVDPPGETPPYTAAEPIEVAFVAAAATDDDLVAGRGGAAVARITTGRAAGTSATGATTGIGDDAPPGSTTGTGTGAPNGLWRMRGPDFTLGGGFVDRFLESSKPLERPATKTGRVHGTAGGTAVIEDRVTTITIDRDGRAHFHDKPDFSWEWDIHLPTPAQIKEMLRDAGQGVAEWYKDPYAMQRAGRVQDLPRHMTAYPGACDSFMDACSIEQRGLEQQKDDPSGSLAHGNFNITDYLMRKTVGDPYSSRKLELLDRTRDERAEMGEKHAREDLARSAEFTRRNLEALWRSTSDPAARKAALFAMWDECSEAEGAVGEAGQRARLVVIGWLRAKLPAGSHDAFTAGEIAHFDGKRSSKQHFAPYSDEP